MTRPASAASVAPAPARSAGARGPAKSSLASSRSATGSRRRASASRFIEPHCARDRSSGSGRGELRVSFVPLATGASISDTSEGRSTPSSGRPSSPVASRATWRASDQSTTRRTLQLRQLLLESHDGLEEVSPLADALEHLVRVEHQGVWILVGQSGLNLLPRERRRHRRTLSCPEGVDADRRLVLVVLAPVDQHLPAP